MNERFEMAVPNPLISVIIPCYRQGHFLGAAIDSVLAQDYRWREIIVVNDGSDDNTEEVALSYGDQIKYLTKPNGGLPAARNSGLQIAQGKYVNFLDSDDLLHPQALSWMMEGMGDREDTIVVTGYKNFTQSPDDANGTESLPGIVLTPFPNLLHGNFGPPNMLLMPRKLVAEAGYFDESLKSCEDWNMWLRLIFAGAQLVSVRKIATYYRRHSASMTNHRPRMLHARTLVMQLTHDHFLKSPELLSAYGNELLEAEHRVLRRWMATGFDPQWVPRIQSMIRELEQRGFALHRSPVRRTLDRWLGKWSDVLALQYFRRFRPAEYQSYLEGCN